MVSYLYTVDKNSDSILLKVSSCNTRTFIAVIKIFKWRLLSTQDEELVFLFFFALSVEVCSCSCHVKREESSTLRWFYYLHPSTQTSKGEGQTQCFIG